jgi:hypothetical protein
VETSLLQMPDGKSAFKIYYVSIIGRDDPSRFEWEHCPLSRTDFERDFLAAGCDGVGFITAFPHIIKVFRFAPSMETVLHVRAFHTAGLAPLELARDEGYMEFACYAEAAIAADEYHAWANAATVADYLAYRSAFADGPVASNTKMAEYFAG